MTVAFKSALTSANLNAKFISRTDNENASGDINFVNGIQINGITLDKASGVLDVGDTGGIKISDGTTAQRPTAGNGVFRYNTTNNKFEGYENGSWTNFIGSANARSFRAASTTDSITTADDTVSYSGASFTATLPTAIGNSGKRFTIVHAGTSLTQVYTLATTGGQTIGGIASGSYKLFTSGESLTIESNGANWLIVDHVTNTATVDHGSATALITAVTTNPTFGTLTRNKVFGRRFGEYYELDYQVAMSTNGTAGSGDYLYALPAGLTIDTNVYPATTAVAGVGNIFPLPTYGSRYYYATGPSSNAMGPALAYNTTQFRVFANTIQAGLFHSSTSTQFSATISYAFTVRVKITDWQP